MKVVTSIVGDRDTIRDDQNIKGAEFIAFTKQPSKTWHRRKPCDLFKSPAMNAKIHKVLIHKFIDTDISLWMDGNYVLLVPAIKVVRDLLGKYDLTIFNHPSRDCVYQEIKECIKRGFGDPVKLIAQRDKYLKEGYPEHKGLAQCPVILRRHNKRVAKFNEAWWAEICRHSVRDQISFPYVASKNKVRINYLKGRGYVENHPYFDYNFH